MNKLVRGAIAASAVIAPLVVAPSAMAAPNDGECTFTESCVFKLKNYGGGMADISLSDADWHNNYFSTGGNAHNSGSSGFAIDRVTRYYGAINYAGRWFILGMNEYDTHWTTNQRNTLAEWKSFDFDNQISANSVYIP